MQPNTHTTPLSYLCGRVRTQNIGKNHHANFMYRACMLPSLGQFNDLTRAHVPDARGDGRDRQLQTVQAQKTRSAITCARDRGPRRVIHSNGCGVATSLAVGRYMLRKSRWPPHLCRYRRMRTQHASVSDAANMCAGHNRMQNSFLARVMHRVEC